MNGFERKLADTSEIPDLVIKHLQDIQFESDIDHVGKSTELEISNSETEYNANLMKLKMLNLSVIRQIAGSHLVTRGSTGDYTNLGSKFYSGFGGKFQNAADWFLYKQSIKYLQPSNQEKNLYGVTYVASYNEFLSKFKYKTIKERRPLAIATLGQYPVVNLDNQIEYMNVGFIDCESQEIYLHKMGKEKRVWDGYEPHLVSFISLERIERTLDEIPDPQEIRQSYDPEKKTFSFDPQISVKYSKIFQARKIQPLINIGISDQEMNDMNLLESVLNFSAISPDFNQRYIEVILEGYLKQRTDLLKLLSN